MGVAEGVDADAGDQVQVALPIGVVDVAALAAAQQERVPAVVLKQILLLEAPSLPFPFLHDTASVAHGSRGAPRIRQVALSPLSARVAGQEPAGTDAGPREGRGGVRRPARPPGRPRTHSPASTRESRAPAATPKEPLRADRPQTQRARVRLPFKETRTPQLLMFTVWAGRLAVGLEGRDKLQSRRTEYRVPRRRSINIKLASRLTHRQGKTPHTAVEEVPGLPWNQGLRRAGIILP